MSVVRRRQAIKSQRKFNLARKEDWQKKSQEYFIAKANVQETVKNFIKKSNDLSTDTEEMIQ